MEMFSRTYSADIDELLKLGTMCRELRKENDLLRESLSHEHSKSSQLFKKLEGDVSQLTEVHVKDTKLIEELEIELRKCSCEIEYLQDQLHLKNVEANCVAEHVHGLELKLVEIRNLNERVSQIQYEFLISDSNRLLLMRELEQKQLDLENSVRYIDKLDATIESNTLESQCEIESLMLDLSASEERVAQAKRESEQAAREAAKMASMLRQLEDCLVEEQHMTNQLQNEKSLLQERLERFKRQTISFCCELQCLIDEQRKSRCHSGSFALKNSCLSVSIASNNELPEGKEKCIGEEIFAPLLSNLSLLKCWDCKLLDGGQNPSCQCNGLQLVKQLKEELQAEKLKAREEAEDLTQEMAELRYHTTELLEEERKRHALIEQTSLLRIKELEENVHNERKKLLASERHLREAEELSKAQQREIIRLNDVLLRLQVGNGPDAAAQNVETCTCGICGFSETPVP